MKLSYYTYSEPRGKNLVIYNCRTDALVVLNEDLRSLWEKHIPEHIDCLKDIHPTFYSHLIQKKFIVNDDINEAADFQNELREIDKSFDSFCIYVNPTLNCNMHCWYCYEEHRPNTRMKEWVKSAILRFAEGKISQSQLKTFKLSFFGGEPLLEFDKVVFPLVSECHNLCQKYKKNFNVSFTSNSYLLTEKMIDELSGLHLENPISWQITIDGNRNTHNNVRYTSNGEGSYDVIVRNIHLLVERGMYVLVRFNYQHKNILSFLDVINDFADIAIKYNKFIRFQFQQIWQDSNGNLLPSEKEANLRKVQKSFADAGFRIGDTKERPQRCYADKENSIVINYNGDLYNCTAQDFTQESKEGELSIDGTLHKNAIYNQRMLKKYNNATCNQCKIYPLCFGNCSQQQMHRQELNECVKNWDEKDKIGIIQKRVNTLIKFIQ